MIGSFSGIHSAKPMMHSRRPPRDNSGGGGGSPPATIPDPYRQFITNAGTISLWNSAPSGSWVRVTAAEYRALTASLGANLIRKGHADAIIDTRLSSTTWGLPLTPTTADTSQSFFTFEPGEYLVAFIAETWNQAGTTWLGYTQQFVTGSPVFPVTGTIAFGGGRTYFIRKAIVSGTTDAFTPVTESLIPVVNYNQSPNAISQVEGRAYRYSSSLSADPQWVLAPQSPKMQVIMVANNPWAN